MTNFSTFPSIPSLQAKSQRALSAVGQILRPLSLSLFITMVFSFAALAQTAVKARPADFIVAVVNSEPITNNEVQALKSRLENELPPGTKLPEGQNLAKQALDQLIIEKAQLQIKADLPSPETILAVVYETGSKYRELDDVLSDLEKRRRRILEDYQNLQNARAIDVKAAE